VARGKVRRKLLVTEYSPTILEILKSVLIEEGYEVIAAADGQQELDRARTEKPGLIILDLMLPKIEGYQVCRMLKFDARFKNITIKIICA
jgi:DNA-binding response OmpR family regulator